MPVALDPTIEIAIKEEISKAIPCDEEYCPHPGYAAVRAVCRTCGEVQALMCFHHVALLRFEMTKARIFPSATLVHKPYTDEHAIDYESIKIDPL